jgi:GTP pyrophosphokinase
VADLVFNLKKFKEFQLKVSTQQDEQKLFLAAAKSPRLILLRLAKRLAYSKFLDKIKPEEQKLFARQTMQARVPVAHKLGLHYIKSALEDYSFKHLEPLEFSRIENKLKEKKQGGEIKSLHAELQKMLKEKNIPAKIASRPKHIYSIYKKMQRKQKPLEEIYDITALRVITDSKRHCYEILGLVHSVWKPIPEEFDDYIAKPKPNGYQSLHTTLVGSDGKLFEIQIRTHKMDLLAEFGLAIHWRYKGIHTDKKADRKLSWIKQAISSRNDLRMGGEMIDSLKSELVEDEIFVFTPKQEVVVLSQGATVLDFAYAIHTNIGHTCDKAKVNGKLAALSQDLATGDTVEITSSAQQQPKPAWLNFVKTTKARAKIRAKLHLDKATKQDWQFKTIDEVIVSLDKPGIRLARCCLPIPGDKVLGYQTTKRKTVIHRRECPNMAKHLNSKKMVKAEWDVRKKEGYLVELKFEALYRQGLLGDLLKAVQEANINLRGTEARAVDSGVKGILSLETKNQKQLEEIIDKLSKIESVTSIQRL